MKVYHNPSTVIARRMSITAYRKSQFSLSIKARDILETEFDFTNASALMHVKETSYKAENRQPVLVFSSIGDEPEITFVDSEDGGSSSIEINKTDIDIPAGKYYYDLFVIKDSSPECWQYGDFYLMQNITEYVEPEHEQT